MHLLCAVHTIEHTSFGDSNVVGCLNCAHGCLHQPGVAAFVCFQKVSLELEGEPQATKPAIGRIQRRIKPSFVWGA
jgi:hypothetical protein